MREAQYSTFLLNKYCGYSKASGNATAFAIAVTVT